MATIENLAHSQGLKVSRILQAGYIFECEDTQIAFDPIFENPFSHNCFAFPDISFSHDQIRSLKLDAVFISHFHDDHCSMESLHFLNRETPIFLYCIFEEMFHLIRSLGFRTVVPLKLNTPVVVGPIQVIPRAALDPEVDSIFHIQAQGINVLNVVDSWIDPSALKILAKTSGWDMVLWPFQTMREIAVLAPSRATPPETELPEEWIQQLKILNPRYLVPSSCQFIQEPWSWYNHALFPISYQQFNAETLKELPQTEILRLNPSASVTLKKASLEKNPPLQWLHPQGNQDVDYTFIPHQRVPASSEVSKNFPPLTSEQIEKVRTYCHSGLIAKYESLEPPHDIYFEKSRLWRLSVYDHEGIPTHYYYHLKDNTIQLGSDTDSPIAWATEISLSKLYAAVELGEALTSLYLRINDIVFETQIEAQIKFADIMEDPLIRCLFHNSFGSYQKAQLKRLAQHRVNP